MFELLIVVILCKVFWEYGRTMGTGKWLSPGLYILSWLGCSQFGFALFAPLVAIVPASVVLILISCMRDKQRIQEMRDKKQQDAQRPAIPNVYQPRQ